MTKASRRQQRAGNTTPTTAAGATDQANASPPTGASGAPTGSVRPASLSPVGTPRVGRRAKARHRPGHEPSRLERYRTVLVAVAVVAAVALIGGFVFVSASRAAYTCTTVWAPAATASPAAGASNPPGYVQPDNGRRHVEYGAEVTYQYCAPASGPHYNKAGSGPIKPLLYGPQDSVLPQAWIHNLEHGAMIVLYTGSSEGATPEGQKQTRGRDGDAGQDQPAVDAQQRIRLVGQGQDLLRLLER